MTFKLKTEESFLKKKLLFFLYETCSNHLKKKKKKIDIKKVDVRYGASIQFDIKYGSGAGGIGTCSMSNNVSPTIREKYSVLVQLSVDNGAGWNTLGTVPSSLTTEGFRTIAYNIPQRAKTSMTIFRIFQLNWQEGGADLRGIFAIDKLRIIGPAVSSTAAFRRYYPHVRQLNLHEKTNNDIC